MTLEWYNTKKLEKYAPDANLYFIVGARRIGKTLHFQKKSFELFKETGQQTMWIRNKKVEFADPSFIADFLNAGRKFGWIDDDWFTQPDGVYTGEGENVIKFQSISTFSNRRGNMTADVGQIVFDEFMPEDRRYPKRAHIGLMSLTKTVLSGKRDAKCYCLSNFISAANPYWVGFQIYPDPKKDVTNFPDKGIAIEVCRGYRCAIEEDNPWNRVYKAGGYQDYASETEDSLWQLISKVPKGGELHPYFVMRDGVVYGGTWYNGILYWHVYNNQVNKDHYIFATTVQEVGGRVTLMPPFFKRDLKEYMLHGMMRFQNANVMYAILNIIFETV
jgi:hypothetical protein